MAALPTLDEMKSGAVMLIDKPKTWTSFDAIKKLKYKIRTKIGHCGTLDPLATGLLIACTGKMTKQIANYQKQDKEYVGILNLGATTPTYDLESEPEDFKPFKNITEADIYNAKAKFTGDIEQFPPAHSAVRHKGKRAYEYARAGEKVKLKSRKVTISEFKISKIELPEIHFRINCTTGTYIRSLTHDFGRELGCGAYLKSLRRTKIGQYSVDDALNVEDWVAYILEENEK